MMWQEIFRLITKTYIGKFICSVIIVFVFLYLFMLLFMHQIEILMNKTMHHIENLMDKSTAKLENATIRMIDYSGMRNITQNDVLLSVNRN